MHRSSMERWVFNTFYVIYLFSNRRDPFVNPMKCGGVVTHFGDEMAAVVKKSMLITAANSKNLYIFLNPSPIIIWSYDNDNMGEGIMIGNAGVPQYELPRLKCHRCGHKWIPRSDEPPVACPACKSPYWRKPRGTEDKIKEEC